MSVHEGPSGNTNANCTNKILFANSMSNNKEDIKTTTTTTTTETATSHPDRYLQNAEYTEPRTSTEINNEWNFKLSFNKDLFSRETMSDPKVSFSKLPRMIGNTPDSQTDIRWKAWSGWWSRVRSAPFRTWRPTDWTGGLFPGTWGGSEQRRWRGSRRSSCFAAGALSLWWDCVNFVNLRMRIKCQLLSHS